MTMKKKLTVIVTAVTLVALIAIGATLAWFTDSKEVTNVVTMGNVRITLTEPIFSAEHENNTIADVLPGQPIVKDPTIENVGNNDAYIRTKIEIVSENENFTADRAAEVEAALDVTDGWVKGEDGYYYYQNVLAAGADPITLFTGLTIPTSWGNEMKDVTFDINITAYAIQSDYFTPDKEEDIIVGWSAAEAAE